MNVQLGENWCEGSVDVTMSWCPEAVSRESVRTSDVVENGSHSVSQQTVTSKQEGGCVQTGYSPFPLLHFPGQFPLVTLPSGFLNGTKQEITEPLGTEVSQLLCGAAHCKWLGHLPLSTGR